jgi:hypothetical protein
MQIISVEIENADSPGAKACVILRIIDFLRKTAFHLRLRA